MTTFLVTGATGFIGSRLCELAAERRHTVRTLTRRDWSARPDVPPDQRFFGSLPNEIPIEALRGTDVVVHCAAVTEAAPRLAQAVNVAGTLELARAARSAGVRTFIFLSTQSAKPHATSVYGRTKFDAEQALRTVTGIDAIVIRAGLVCGPGSRGLFQRMCAMVERLPVLPLLGGGVALVQPIAVDDLCEAIFRCASRSSEFAGATLHLGDPVGMPLREFLQQIAHVRLGRSKIAVPVPLWPVAVGVRAAELLRVSLPINANNVKGLAAVDAMPSGPDLARLGLTLRPVAEMIAPSPEGARELPALERRAVRVMLVGAGRIGVVHALTLSRLHGIDLVGVVDTKKAALGMLRGMGLRTPAFTSLDDAVRETRPDAAVIATPVSSHLPLARACLRHGLRVLVEKPLAIRQPELAAFTALAAEFPQLSIQVGYVMPRNPQVEAMLGRLRAGEFGEVRSFLGLTLHSHVLTLEPNRWETNKALSGGGVLINSGGHVISMVLAAFGEPTSVEAEARAIVSSEVEDSMVLRYTYPGFTGTHCASWSIPGYQRQENRLVIRAERGVLVLTASVAVFVPNGGEPEVCHQLDFDVGFNLAPDYAGAGFTQEAHDLVESTRTGREPPMGVRAAQRVEQLLFRAYDVAKTVHEFSAPAEQPAIAVADAQGSLQNHAWGPAAGVPGAAAALGWPLAGPGPAKPAESNSATRFERLIDLRELAPATVGEFMSDSSASKWDGFVVTTAHLADVARASDGGASLRVTVPDFLTQSRLLMGGRFGEVLGRLGPRGVMGAGFAAVPAVARARGVTFWAAAIGLLAGELAAIPRGFAGTLLLHGYLTDIALALGETASLDRMLRLCRRQHPSARVGFHTNLASAAHAALPLIDTEVDDISALTSPRGLRLTETIRALQAYGPAVAAEVGPAPAFVHALAAETPSAWTQGAGAIVLGPVADAVLGARLRSDKQAAWQTAFPGLVMLEAAL